MVDGGWSMVAGRWWLVEVLLVDDGWSMVAGRGWNIVCYRVMLSCVVRLLLLCASSFVCRLVLSGGLCVVVRVSLGAVW